MKTGNKQITVGLIGFGHWGPNYVRNFNLNPNAVVKTVCDLDRERQETLRELSPASVFTDERADILEDGDIDCVVIATPATTHHQLVKEALLAGKDVLCEKPLADATVRARELARLAAEKNRILGVGHVFRYNNSVQAAAERIGKGDLGRVHYIHFRHTNLGPIRADVNVVWDLAPHAISIFFHIFRKWPERVTAVGKAIFNNRREDFAFITLHYPGDLICHLHVSWIEPQKIRKMVVVGEKKMLIWDDIGTNPLEIHEKTLTREAFYRDFGEFQLIPKVGPTYLPALARSEPLKNLCNDFLDAVRSRKNPLAAADEGAKNTAVIEAVNKSISQGGEPIDVTYP